MRTFKDKTGQTWTIESTIGAVKRVRQLLMVDILSLMDPESKLLDAVTKDPVLLVDVIYAWVLPEAKARGVEDEAFAGLMDGTSIAGATQAFIDAVIDFFPGARGTLLRAAMEKAAEMERASVESIENALAALAPSPASAIPTPDGSSSTSSPRSSGSTRPRSRSRN